MSDLVVRPLEDMVIVGEVGRRHAKLWLRSETPGAFAVSWRSAGGGSRGQSEGRVSEASASDRTEVVVLANLSPDTSYRFEATHLDDGHSLGSGAFHTTPASAQDAPESLAFAFMSCNMPFDTRGHVTVAAANMLSAAERVMNDHDVPFFMTLGDQMYTDYPSSQSLFDPAYLRTRVDGRYEDLLDCPEPLVLELVRERYRRFWNLPAWRRMHAVRASYPIWDDHEIVDDWGSTPEHQHPRWSAVKKATRQACYEYQMSRVLGPGDELPATFDYGFDHGNVAVYVLDLRTNRRTGEGGRVISRQQELDLLTFLDEHADQPILFLALSVPLFHLPRRWARLGERLHLTGEGFADRWETLEHLRDRGRLISLLHEHGARHPAQRIVLLSGDIHIACAHEIEWEDGTPSIYQLVSSAITNEEGALLRWGCSRAMLRDRRIETEDGKRCRVRLLAGATRRERNPYRGLNLGLVEVRTRGEDVRLRYTVHGNEGGTPKRVFASTWIPAGRRPARS